MPYQLTYCINFSGMLADEDDYIFYVNHIQSFLNTGMKNQLIIEDPVILPAFDEESMDHGYVVKARFLNTEYLHAGLNMLNSFCMLNFLIGDPDSVIETTV
jgi:hypothetical protein